MTYEEFEKVRELAESLADQQAMPDESWKERLQQIYNQYVTDD